jgi:hypothetical protein
MGSVAMVDQGYTGIFQGISLGRLCFRIVGINKRFFSLEHEQIIESFNTESIQSHAGAYAIMIDEILYYDKKQLFFISYSYKVTDTPRTLYWRGIDLVIKDGDGLTQHHTLKEFMGRNYYPSFAKIINNTLFFAFSDIFKPDKEKTLYAMELDSGKYEVRQYSHDAGEIQNIWLKDRENAEYVFTSKRDSAIISGVFKITVEDNIEMPEIYDRKIAGYDTLDGSSFYYRRDNVLMYQGGNGSVTCAVKKFMGKEESIYDIFFLEDGSFIIGSTKTGPHYIANFLFGEGNLMHYFYYYHAIINERGDDFIVKKIRTFGSRLWKLEQLVINE